MTGPAISALAVRHDEQAARAYFDYAITGILETDGAWHIRRANPAAASITGLEQKALDGLTLAAALRVADGDRLDRHLTLVAEQGIHQSELHATRADGEAMIITLASVQAGEDFYLHVLDDVTAARRATAELEAARAQAEAADRAKSEFLANVSHEIRTPLNGILGLARIALDSATDGEQREHIEGILASGTHLLSIVNDLLDSAKLDAGRMDFDDSPYELAGVLSELQALRAQIPAGRPLVLDVEAAADLPPVLVGDRLRIVQCLTNLVGNAIKFTAAGRVVLAAARDPEQPDMLRFTVADTGCGIAPGTLARLFAPFSQADGSTARRFGGTGLGLHIARSMARGMGGDLRAESELGSGSRFILTLPLRSAVVPPDGHPALETAYIPTEFRGRHILVAEDNEVNLKVILHWLRQAGIQTSVSENGTAVLDRLAAAPPPDLILMDIQMPGMDGLEATRRLRARGFERPIVGLSAGATRVEQEACLASGMSDFLSKPIDLDELWGCLTRWLSPHQPARSEATCDEPTEIIGIDDPDFLNQLVCSFRETHGEDGTRMQAMIDSGNNLGARVLAHTLKGSAGLLGLAAVVELARALEIALDLPGDKEALRMLITDLQCQLDLFSDSAGV